MGKGNIMKALRLVLSQESGSGLLLFKSIVKKPSYFKQCQAVLRNTILNLLPFYYCYSLPSL